MLFVFCTPFYDGSKPPSQFLYGQTPVSFHFFSDGNEATVGHGFRAKVCAFGCKPAEAPAHPTHLPVGV